MAKVTIYSDVALNAV